MRGDRHTHNQLLDRYEQAHQQPPLSERETDPARRGLHVGAAVLACTAALFPFMLALVAGASLTAALAAGGAAVLAFGIWGVAGRGWPRFPIALALVVVLFVLAGFYVYRHVDLGYW